MYKNSQTLIFFLFAILFSSCEKEEPEIIDNRISDFSLADMKSSVFSFQKFIGVEQESDISIYGSNKDGIPKELIITGYFSINEKPLISVNEFKVNGSSIPKIDEQGLIFYQKKQPINFTNNSMFGREILVNVKGGPYGDLEESIYSPQLIDFTISGNSTVASKGSDLRISWSPDTTFDSIHVYLIPKPYKKSNPRDLTEVHLVVENNGSCTLLKEYWATYDVGDKYSRPDQFEILIGWANQKLIVHEPNKETLITVYNYDSHTLSVSD